MNVAERALIAARHEEPDRVPVVLQIYSLVLKRYGRVIETDYLRDLVRLQLQSKIAFTNRFPDVLNIVGASPEHSFFGPATGFGGKLKWMGDAPPFIGEYPIKEPEDVDRLEEAGVPDPCEVGSTAVMLERLEYFWEWFPEDLRDRYAPFYLDNYVNPCSPSEGTALTLGYDKWITWMRLHPDVLHKLLRMVNEFSLKYCEAQEEIVGPAKFVWMIDHSPSFVGPEQFREFILPYLNRVLDRYEGALREWHNEGYVGYMLDDVDKIHAEIWHLGYEEDLALCKEKTHFCLQGNIHPPIFAKLNPEQVEEECRKIIVKAGRGGGLWLSTGGGMAPGTPMRNIAAMLRAVEKYGIYPIRGEE